MADGKSGKIETTIFQAGNQAALLLGVGTSLADRKMKVFNPRSLLKKSPGTPEAGRTGFPQGHARVLLLSALVACATLPYLNMLFNGFVYDDNTQLLKNPYIRNFHYLKAIFTTDVWSFSGLPVSNYYRPMMMTGYLVCYKLFGLRASCFHLVSLLLHVLVVFLVFALAERATGDRVCAFVAGALFALHPVHTESVAWIAGVTDLELTFFYLLTFGFFLASARPGGRQSKSMLAATVVSFIFALLAKEQAMTLPALATVYEHFYRGDHSETSTSQKAARYSPLWVLCVTYVAFRIRFLGALAPARNLPGMTLGQTLLSAVALVGQYVGKVLWPVRLCLFWVFRPSTSPFDPRVLAGLSVLSALLAVFLVCWRSREHDVRFASFAILWFFATLAPVLNAHWVGEDVFAERYLYLPSVGVAWLIGVGASELWRLAMLLPAQRRALLLAGIALSGLFAARIVIRNRDWKNEEVLYTRTLEVSPDAGRILSLLARVYWDEGAVDKAEKVWERMLASHPGDPEVLNTLRTVESLKHQYPWVLKSLQQSGKLRP
jgi:hypothetical protein